MRNYDRGTPFRRSADARSSLYPLWPGRSGPGCLDRGRSSVGEDDIERALELAAFLDAEGQGGARQSDAAASRRSWAGSRASGRSRISRRASRQERGRSGIKIVTGEAVALRNYRPPKDPKQDRLFLSIQVQGAAPMSTAKRKCRPSGGPGTRSHGAVTFPRRRSLLSKYMQFAALCGVRIGLAAADEFRDAAERRAV